jgi:hypothetical protein
MKDPDTAIVCYERCLTFLDPAERDYSIFGNLYLSCGHARLNKSEIMEAMECYDNGKLSLTLFSQWNKMLHSANAMVPSSFEKQNGTSRKGSSNNGEGISEYGYCEVSVEKFRRSKNILE